MKNNRIAIPLLAIITAMCSAVSCGPRPPPPPSEDLVKVRIGYIPIVECAHLYVGIAKGFFEQEGLNVEMVPMKGGASILPTVQKGDIDIGFANIVSLLLLNSQSGPSRADWLVSIAGASYERPGHSNHALITRRGETFTPQALTSATTRIGINTTRNIEELMLLQYLKKNNVAFDTLTLVTIPFPEMLAALRNHSIDVASVVEPFIEPAIRSGSFTLNSRQYLEVSTNTLVAAYVSASEWLGKNGKTVEKFRRAFQRADEFIKQHDLESRQIIGSFTRIGEADIPVIGLPAFEPRVGLNDLNNIAAMMKEANFISAMPDTSAMILASP